MKSALKKALVGLTVALVTCGSVLFVPGLFGNGKPTEVTTQTELAPASAAVPAEAVPGAPTPSPIPTEAVATAVVIEISPAEAAEPAEPTPTAVVATAVPATPVPTPTAEAITIQSSEAAADLEPTVPVEPAAEPTPAPTVAPTPTVEPEPSPEPTAIPDPSPTPEPVIEPTTVPATATAVPEPSPTPEPTAPPAPTATPEPTATPDSGSSTLLVEAGWMYVDSFDGLFLRDAPGGQITNVLTHRTQVYVTGEIALTGERFWMEVSDPETGWVAMDFLTTVAPPKPVQPTPGAPSEPPTEADWVAFRQCESGGRYSVVDPSGLYHGAYQFLPSTWDGLARRFWPELVGVLPSQASPQDQDKMARKLFELEGASPWPICGQHLL